jgi:hypothetical protein
MADSLDTTNVAPAINNQKNETHEKENMEAWLVRKELEEKLNPLEFRNQFRVKPIPKKKKKKPQPTMKAFFMTKTNFQGFDINLCKYEPSLMERVYVPQSYGVISRTYGRRIEFCKSCMLSPCVTIEHMEDSCGEASRLRTQDGKTNHEARPCLEAKMRHIMAHHFGRGYMKGMPTPKCVRDDIDYYLPTEILPGGSSSDDSDSGGACDSDESGDANEELEREW